MQIITIRGVVHDRMSGWIYNYFEISAYHQ